MKNRNKKYVSWKREEMKIWMKSMKSIDWNSI